MGIMVMRVLVMVGGNGTRITESGEGNIQY